MAEDTGDDSGNGSRSAEEAALSARLKSLGERLDHQKGPGRQAETAFRFEERSVGTRPRLPPLHRTGGRCPGRCVHRLGARQVARNLAVGDDGVSSARLCRRRRQRGARRRRFQRTGQSHDRRTGGEQDCRKLPAMADPIHQFEIHNLVPLGHIGGHEIAFTNSALYMAIVVVGIAALLVGAQLRPRAGAGADAVDRGAVLRVRRRHHKQHRRQGRDEVLPLRVHAFHVRPGGERHRPDPLHLHGDKPHHHHRGPGADGVPDRGRLRLLQERPEVLQPVRAAAASRSTSCR